MLEHKAKNENVIPALNGLENVKDVRKSLKAATNSTVKYCSGQEFQYEKKSLMYKCSSYSMSGSALSEVQHIHSALSF